MSVKCLGHSSEGSGDEVLSIEFICLATRHLSTRQLTLRPPDTLPLLQPESAPNHLSINPMSLPAEPIS